MRISDWSSDVCSSDLREFTSIVRNRGDLGGAWAYAVRFRRPWRRSSARGAVAASRRHLHAGSRGDGDIHRESGSRPQRPRGPSAVSDRFGGDRESVVWGKGVSVRVDPGGRGFIKKKK